MSKSKNHVTIPENLSIPDCHLRIEQIDGELLRLGDQAAAIRTELAKLNSEKDQLENRVAALREKPHVSDHAVLRYLERKYDFDSDQIRKEILSPELRSAVSAGATGFKSGGGTFKLRGTTVVTYVHPKKG